MVKETQTTRLDRIEDKIDKLSDAIVSLARVEEKIASMEAQLVNGHDRMNKHGIKLDAIESQVQSNAQTVSVIHKVFWIVIVCLFYCSRICHRKYVVGIKMTDVNKNIIDAYKSMYEPKEEVLDETNKNDKSDDGEGLDAVQPDAVKKKFKDRKDKDIDNDGDVDSSDEYLHKEEKQYLKQCRKGKSKRF